MCDCLADLFTLKNWAENFTATSTHSLQIIMINSPQRQLGFLSHRPSVRIIYDRGEIKAFTALLTCMYNTTNPQGLHRLLPIDVQHFYELLVTTFGNL